MIIVQFKYNGEYYLYHFKNLDNNPLENIKSENIITLKYGFHPDAIINDSIFPLHYEVFTQQQHLDQNDDCVIL
jgi:hypothetical protein